jgi:dTDP-4-dehydrorhamnose 3,5-epimerase
MQIIPTSLEGVFIIEPVVHEDPRGFFVETYNKKVWEQRGLFYDFIQDNHSLSVEPGVIRGLHYQLTPKAQTKLVRVIAGAIYDVAVDIRKNSSTFGQYVGVILSASNKRQLLIPKGYAHGFCTIVPNTEVVYKVDEYYSPEHDRGIIWNDPQLNIAWPMLNPILSQKDTQLPNLNEIELPSLLEGSK